MLDDHSREAGVFANPCLSGTQADRDSFDTCWQGKVNIVNGVPALRASALTHLLHVTFILMLSAKESYIVHT